MQAANSARSPRTITRERVAFQGELGAFSEEAVGMYFGDAAEPVPCRTFAQLCTAVEEGTVEYGLLPIENTTVGAVGPAHDALEQSRLVVVGEVVCAVRHCLLAWPGTRIEQLHRAWSHPVALAQCTNFFTRHAAIEPVAIYDTAGAARQVAELKDAGTAAVAGLRAAERYGLDVLAADIQDRDDNQTRFLVVARSDAGQHHKRRSPRKTALLLETHNRPGALVAALQAFAVRGINLSSLQSRPGLQPWTYRFFLELDGDRSDRELAGALAQVERDAVALRVLGSYASWLGQAQQDARDDGLAS